MTPNPKAPQGVTLFYMDGSETPIESLLYVGEESDDKGVMHVWEALDPLPTKAISRMTVAMMPAHTRVVVVR